MFDPDAPSSSNPVNAEWRHWLVVNIPGSKIDDGETKIQYAPPQPPKGSGRHRYIFAVYKQKDCKRTSFSGLTTERAKTSVVKLKENYKLDQSPESANVFFAENK